MKKFMRQIFTIIIALFSTLNIKAMTELPAPKQAQQPKQIVHPAKITSRPAGALNIHRKTPTITIKKVSHTGPSRYAEKMRPNNTLTQNIKNEKQRQVQARAQAHRNKQAVAKQAITKQPTTKQAIAQQIIKQAIAKQAIAKQALAKQALAKQALAKMTPAQRRAQRKAQRKLRHMQVAGDDIEEVDAPKNIEPSKPIEDIDDVPETYDPKVITIPADFTDTYAKTGAISVGSRNGVLEAWCIAPGGTHLLRYNSTDVNPSPTQEKNQWVMMTVQNTNGQNIGLIKSVAISSDGELVILDAPGRAYRYNWDKKQFALIPIGLAHRFDQTTGLLIKHADKLLGLDYIAVGNINNIWAVDIDAKMIYKFNNQTNTWDPMVDGIYVSVGLDGFVISIDENYVPHIYAGNNTWYAMSDIKLDHVAVGTQNYIYGTYKGVLYRHNKSWNQLLGADGKPTNGILNVTTNAVGTVFITSHGEIYNKGEDGVLAEKTGGKIKIKKAQRARKLGVGVQAKQAGVKPGAKAGVKKPATKVAVKSVIKK